MTHKTPPHCGNFWRPERGILVTRSRQNKHKKLGNPFFADEPATFNQATRGTQKMSKVRTSSKHIIKLNKFLIIRWSE